MSAPRRVLVLDTETTGLLPEEGHRIIEIGIVEVDGDHPTGREYQVLLDPERDIDPGAERVNGYSREWLLGRPTFEDVAQDVLRFIDGTELVIQNASFDVGFLDAEFSRYLGGHGWQGIARVCDITCTKRLARDLYPGERSSLNDLCRRFGIDRGDRAARTGHGALTDARLLAQVWPHLVREERQRMAFRGMHSLAVAAGCAE